MPKMSVSWKHLVPIAGALTCRVLITLRHRIHLGGGRSRDQIGGAGPQVFPKTHPPRPVERALGIGSMGMPPVLVAHKMCLSQPWLSGPDAGLGKWAGWRRRIANCLTFVTMRASSGLLAAASMVTRQGMDRCLDFAA